MYIIDIHCVVLSEVSGGQKKYNVQHTMYNSVLLSYSLEQPESLIIYQSEEIPCHACRANFLSCEDHQSCFV